jgi:hypothetical protein
VKDAAPELPEQPSLPDSWSLSVRGEQGQGAGLAGLAGLGGQGGYDKLVIIGPEWLSVPNVLIYSHREMCDHGCWHSRLYNNAVNSCCLATLLAPG